MADGYTELSNESLQTPQGVSELNRMLRTLFDNVAGNTVDVRVFSGFGTPEGNIAANVGAIFMRLDGGANTSQYIKESGDGDTGWIAK